ncbi:hypothetical protein [Acinetobacter sp. CFCC 10889]|uniref:hypothetical protein n=1 Tax=Acinetobacter sp. CFCC 10889 TaxID=1775557 RepID=UPI000DD0C2DD|nr:hypothetical protein [Acinetobacter sp. CFCC 10889]
MTNVSHTNELAKEKLPKYIETELGTEKLCIDCEEFWWTRKNKSLKDPNGVRYEAACKCCYNVRYRPGHVKGTYKVKSQHEKVAA